MNLKQINWASQHDWFIKVNAAGDGVVVNDFSLQPAFVRSDNGSLDYRAGGMREVEVEREFKDYGSLRSWAGY